jgi:hypothetical protein
MQTNIISGKLGAGSFHRLLHYYKRRAGFHAALYSGTSESLSDPERSGSAISPVRELQQ